MKNIIICGFILLNLKPDERHFFQKYSCLSLLKNKKKNVWFVKCLVTQAHAFTVKFDTFKNLFYLNISAVRTLIGCS